MQPMKLNKLGIVAGAVLALASAGCLFSPDGGNDNPIPPTPVPFPDTPDKLIANWRSAYEEMDIDKYRDVIHPDYLFVFSDEDINNGTFPTTPLTRDEELAIAQNMFSGQPGQGPDGPVAAISSIQITQWNPLGDNWEPTAPNDPDFPNCKRRLFQVRTEFFKVDTGKITVQGEQAFYVAWRDSLVDGVTKDYYQLRGWKDYSTAQ